MGRCDWKTFSSSWFASLFFQRTSNALSVIEKEKKTSVKRINRKLNNTFSLLNVGRRINVAMACVLWFPLYYSVQFCTGCWTLSSLLLVQKIKTKQPKGKLHTREPKSPNIVWKSVCVHVCMCVCQCVSVCVSVFVCVLVCFWLTRWSQASSRSCMTFFSYLWSVFLFALLSATMQAPLTTNGKLFISLTVYRVEDFHFKARFINTQMIAVVSLA